jgi:hypothetical protein
MRHLIAECQSLGSSGRLFLFADCGTLDSHVILRREWVTGRGEAIQIFPED